MTSGLRSRARQHAINLSGGGGGGPAPAGLVQWGPDFGERAGNDGVTFEAGAAVDLATANLASTLGVGQAVALDHVNMAASFGAGTGVDLASVDLAAVLDPGVAVSLDTVDLAAALGVGSAVAVDRVDPAAVLGVGAAVDLATVNMASTLGVGAALTGTYTITGLLTDDDTELDRANPDTNYGTAVTARAKANTAVVNDDRNAYLAWDLTGLASGSVTSATMRIHTRDSAGLGGINPGFEIYTHGSQPFDEATATWNADEPPPGTQRQTGTVSAPASFAEQTISLNAGARNNMPGNWLYLRLHGDNMLSTNQAHVACKEHGTASVRPTLDLTVEIT